MPDALPDPLTIDPATLPPGVLRRLIEEIQREDPPERLAQKSYDRIHNRHNRGPGPYAGRVPEEDADA